MADDRSFFVSYPGPLGAEDRAALTRPEFKLYENGYGVSSAAWGQHTEPRDMTMFQVVRVFASSEDDARQQVVQALGHVPDGLRVMAGLEENGTTLEP